MVTVKWSKRTIITSNREQSLPWLVLNRHPLDCASGQLEEYEGTKVNLLHHKKATLKNGHSYESTEKIVKSSLRNVGTESLGRSKIDKSLSWQGLLVSLLAKDSSTDSWSCPGMGGPRFKSWAYSIHGF